MATPNKPERPFDGLIRREIDVEFRSINEDERSFEVIASSETLDSHGDVLRQFWDLSRFDKNGCVLWNHNSTSYLGADPEDTLPIGKATDVRVENKKLIAKIWLLKGEAETEPLVDKIWRRVQQEVIKAVSVGFRPGQVTRKVNAAGETEFYELGSKDRPNELREISLVPMGSNPDAVAKSIACERSHLAKLITKDSEVRTAASEPTAVSGKEKQMNEEQFKAAIAKVEAALAEANAQKGAAEQKTVAAETRATTAEERIKTLETDLTAEKAISKKLEGELATERTESKKLKTELAKSALDTLQGVKFAPAEREELDGLVESVGIDRVKSLLSKRTDIVLTDPVKVDGEEVKPKAAPTTVSADPSADIVATANKNIAAA